MRRTGAILAVFGLTIAWCSVLLAVDGDPVANLSRVKEGLRILDQFNRRLATVYEELQDNTRRSNRRARKHCEKLVRDYMDTLVDDSFAPRFFGYTLFFRAVAEHRLGHPRDAVWYWQMAQEVLPELTNKDFGNFPDAEDFLLAHRISEKDTGKRRRGKCSELSEAEKRALKRPRQIHAPPPVFPRAANANGFSGRVIVDCTIGVDGRTSDPRLVESSGVTAADMSALLALKKWRFKPALRDGEPIASIWRLTVIFARR